MPDLVTFGLGGDELRAAGLQPVAHSSEVAVVGITEVLRILPRIREVFAALLAEVDRRRPDAALLVDFPDFNLRLARELKKRGVRVIYYISPQVWAWRRGRVHTIARLVDRMLVLFPFEVDFYRNHAVDVVHVGHPLVDEVPRLPQAWDAVPPGEEPAGPFRLALLPGSRASEIEALLPAMLEAVRILAAELPVEVRLIKAPTVPRGMLEERIALSGLPVSHRRRGPFRRGRGVPPGALRLGHRDAGGRPAGHADDHGLPPGLPGAGRLAKMLVRLPHVSLVNLVLGRGVIPELVQCDANPERVAAEAARILTGEPGRRAMRAGLAELRDRLGEGGASGRAAAEVAALLEAPVEVPV